MITKIGNAAVKGGSKFAKKLGIGAVAASPFVLAAGWNAPERYRSSMSYRDPMNNEYYREPGIFYDSLKRNPYVNNA